MAFQVEPTQLPPAMAWPRRTRMVGWYWIAAGLFSLAMWMAIAALLGWLF